MLLSRPFYSDPIILVPVNCKRMRCGVKKNNRVKRSLFLRKEVSSDAGDKGELGKNLPSFLLFVGSFYGEMLSLPGSTSCEPVENP